MNKDFRISTTFWQHRKTVRLQLKLGCEGVCSLLKLWAWTALNQPDGFIPMEAAGIEYVADWRGEPGLFVAAAVEIGWLDEAEGGFEVHDWQEHNPWAAETEDRENKARFSRLYSKHGEEARQLSALGVEAVTAEEFKAIKNGGLAAYFAMRPDVAAGVERPLNDAITSVERFDNGSITTVERFDERFGNETISPAPAPLLKDSPPSPPRGGGERDGHDDEGEQPERPPGKDTPPCPHERIVALYHEILPQCPKVKTWNGQGRKQLAVRWREDKARQNLDWWRHVFEDVAKSDFLMGRRPNTNFLFSLGWFVGPKNFEKVLNDHYVNHDAPAEPVGKQIGGLTF